MDCCDKIDKIHNVKQMSSERIHLGQPQSTKNEVKTRPEHLSLEHWSTSSTSSQREAVETWRVEKPKSGGCTGIKRHMLLEFDDILKNARCNGKRHVNQGCPAQQHLCLDFRGKRNQIARVQGHLLRASGKVFERTNFKWCVLTNDHREGAVETQTIRTQESRGRKHQDHIAERGHVTVAPSKTYSYP